MCLLFATAGIAEMSEADARELAFEFGLLGMALALLYMVVVAAFWAVIQGPSYGSHRPGMGAQGMLFVALLPGMGLGAVSALLAGSSFGVPVVDSGVGSSVAAALVLFAYAAGVFWIIRRFLRWAGIKFGPA